MDQEGRRRIEFKRPPPFSDPAPIYRSAHDCAMQAVLHPADTLPGVSINLHPFSSNLHGVSSNLCHSEEPFLTVPDPDMAKVRRLAQVSRAFTPAAPVDNYSLFAGRLDQMHACLDAFSQKGLHIAVYGERGVGKTSLANVLPMIIMGAELPHLGAVRVDCNTNDSYASIWRKVFRELAPLSPSLSEVPDRVTDPEEIRFLLRDLSREALIVLDELDRVEDNEALSLLADTVKTLSDHGTEVTLMFVGVAKSIDHLLGEHESIVRNLRQIPIQRMSRDELETLLEKGFGQVEGLAVAEQATNRIISAAEGLPHFAHLLGLGAGHAAVSDDRCVVEQGDVERAEADAVRTHSMFSEYRRATDSPQPGHLFEQVLLACAYAPRDGVGYFRAGDVRRPLSDIVGRPVTFPQFQRHLAELSGDRQTLYREGEPRHRAYRFRNPLFQPFVKMTARAKSLISDELAAQLQEQQAANSAPVLF
jgi:Cdc6-like AAA superfamily ATPase